MRPPVKAFKGSLNDKGRSETFRDGHYPAFTDEIIQNAFAYKLVDLCSIYIDLIPVYPLKKRRDAGRQGLVPVYWLEFQYRFFPIAKGDFRFYVIFGLRQGEVYFVYTVTNPYLFFQNILYARSCFRVPARLALLIISRLDILLPVYLPDSSLSVDVEHKRITRLPMQAFSRHADIVSPPRGF